MYIYIFVELFYRRPALESARLYITKSDVHNHTITVCFPTLYFSPQVMCLSDCSGKCYGESMWISCLV